MLLDNKSSVKRCSIPTPYPIGDTYAYIIAEDPVTLVDVGVATEEAREAWDYWLKRYGLTVKDIKRIVLTHGHSDHYGLAKEFAERSGAPIYLHPADWKKVMDRVAFYAELVPVIREYGIPEAFLEKFIGILKWERNFCLDIPEEMLHPLQEGDILEFERLTFSIIHVPGHSPGHIILMHRHEALSGDLIFLELTPIPMLETDEKGNRLKTSLLYKDSLAKAKSLGLKTYFPSHREEQGDFDEALKKMEKRMAYKESLILQCIRQKGRCTAYDIIKCLYPNRGPQEIYITVSDVLGRLDLMESKGLIRCEKFHGIWHFREID